MIYYESMIFFWWFWPCIQLKFMIEVCDHDMFESMIFFLKIFIIIFWLFIKSESMINFVNYLGSQKHNDTSLIKNLIVINTSIVESEGK